MKKLVFGLLLFPIFCLAQNVGIGTSNPIARLSVDSSIMVDQSNQNDGVSLRNALVFGSDGLSAIGRSFQVGSAARNGLSFYTKGIRRMTLDSTGQLGIGTVNPQQTLHVIGNTYLNGNLGIGTSAPNYALENLYGYNYMFYALGIGTPPSASYLLDIGSGPTRFQSDVRINGVLNPNNTLTIGNNTVIDGSLTVNSNNAVIDGSLTVNGGKGVAYNPSSATNTKIFAFTTPTFTAILGGHQLSAEGALGFGGGFTNTPRVYVGAESVSGGSAGELHRVQLILYGCDNNSCKARLLNTSPNPVNYSITWDILCVGN